MPALWRVFPWDPSAEPGERLSPSHIPSATGRGRFDLPRRQSRVLYLAETPEHAIAELLQPWRGRALAAAHLEHAGRPLSLVEVVLGSSPDGILDLCDPDILARDGIAPDRIASRHRHVTQPIASVAWEAGRLGLRWWSSFSGDWHTVVLFTARLNDLLTFGEPSPLSVESPAVQAAAEALGME